MKPIGYMFFNKVQGIRLLYNTIQYNTIQYTNIPVIQHIKNQRISNLIKKEIFIDIIYYRKCKTIYGRYFP